MSGERPRLLSLKRRSKFPSAEGIERKVPVRIPTGPESPVEQQFPHVFREQPSAVGTDVKKPSVRTPEQVRGDLRQETRETEASPESESLLKKFIKEQEYAARVQNAMFTPTDLEGTEHFGYAAEYMKTFANMTGKGALSTAGFGAATYFIPWEAMPVIGPFAGLVRPIAGAVAALAPYIILTRKPIETLKNITKLPGMLKTAFIDARKKKKELTAKYPDKSPQEIQQYVILELSLAKDKKVQKRLDELQVQNPTFGRDAILDMFVQQEYAKEHKQELEDLSKQYPGANEMQLRQFIETRKLIRMNKKRIDYLRKQMPGASDEQILEFIQYDQMREAKKEISAKAGIIQLAKMATYLGVPAIALLILPHFVTGVALISAGVLTALTVNLGRRVLVTLLQAPKLTRMSFRKKKWMQDDKDLTDEQKADIDSTVKQLLTGE